MNDLTDKQRDTFRFLLRYRAKKGFFPTYREMGLALDISVPGIQDRLYALKQKGYLTWIKGQPRAFSILKELR